MSDSAGDGGSGGVSSAAGGMWALGEGPAWAQSGVSSRGDKWSREHYM